MVMGTLILYLHIEIKKKKEEGDQIVVNKEFMISKSDKPHEAQADAAYPNFVHYCRNKK